MSRKKILVTGGAGYIGSHTIVELVAAGYQPIIVDNFVTSSKEVIKNIRKITGITPNVYIANCSDRESLAEVFRKETEIYSIIHFAAFKAVGESVRDPLKYYSNNINSLLNLLQLMNEFEVSNLVFSSSCTVYGQPLKLPVTEHASALNAESPYGSTKQICERVIEDALISTKSLRAVTLRYFNPIGAHPSGLIGENPVGIPENLVPYITQTAAGIRGQLTVFGDDYDTPDGSCIRDYIHVIDLAKAHVKSLEWLKSPAAAKDSGVFNIGMGKGHSVLEIIEAFEKISRIKLNYVIGPRRSGDIEQIFANVDKAQKMLSWESKLSIQDALRDTWNWQLAVKQRKSV